MNNIGDRIKQIRLENGLTMEEFGKKFNTSKGTVNNWEKGRNKPNKENLKAIAELGNISIDILLYGKPIWSEMDDKYNKDDRLTKDAKQFEQFERYFQSDVGSMLNFLIKQLESDNHLLKFKGMDLDDELREMLKNSLIKIYKNAK